MEKVPFVVFELLLEPFFFFGKGLQLLLGEIKFAVQVLRLLEDINTFFNACHSIPSKEGLFRPPGLGAKM